jgi:hypothetical protein
VTSELFYLILVIQLLLFVRGIIAKDYGHALFSFLSAGLTLMILGLIEYDIHHQMRSSYGIPNTVIYISGFFLIAVFIWSFKKLIMKYDYSLLLMGGALWSLSGLIDLLTDAGIITIIYNDIIESVLFITGTVFLLMFYVSILNIIHTVKKLRKVI